MAGALSQAPPSQAALPRMGQLSVVVENAAENFLIPSFSKRQVVLCAEIVIQKLQTLVVSMETFFTLCK